MDKQLLKDLFHNILFVEEEDGYLVPYRHTHAQCEYYKNVPYGAIMGEKAYCSAGVTLEFDTDATDVMLLWRHTHGYSRTDKDRGSSLDLYINGTLRAQSLIECTRDLPMATAFHLGNGHKRVVITLPHTYNFCLKDIVLPEGATLTAVPKRARKILFLGDSITQGIGAAFSSTGYAMQAGMQLDCEAVNQSIAAIRFEWDSLDNNYFMPDLISVAYGTNDWSARDNKAEYDEYASKFFARMNELYPGVPVAVLSPVKRCRGMSDRHPEHPDSYLESELYGALTRLCAPYPQMKCIDGWTLMPHTADFFLDGIHPNDLGMTWYANSVVKFIRSLL